MSNTPILDRELQTKKESSASSSQTQSKKSQGGSANVKDRLDSQKGSDTLSLVDLFIGDEGAYEAAKFIRHNNNYSSLQLRGNNISAAGFEAICQALKTCSRLKSITAEWNNIGSDISGLIALHQLVRTANNLETIDLKNNRLGQNCGSILGDIIRDSSALKKLDLRWNELGDEGGRAILVAFQESRKKIGIDLNGNKMPEDVLSQIAEFSLSNTSFSVRNTTGQASARHSAVEQEKIPSMKLDNRGSSNSRTNVGENTYSTTKYSQDVKTYTTQNDSSRKKSYETSNYPVSKPLPAIDEKSSVSYSNPSYPPYNESSYTNENNTYTGDKYTSYSASANQPSNLKSSAIVDQSDNYGKAATSSYTIEKSYNYNTSAAPAPNIENSYEKSNISYNTSALGARPDLSTKPPAYTSEKTYNYSSTSPILATNVDVNYAGTKSDALSKPATYTSEYKTYTNTSKILSPPQKDFETHTEYKRDSALPAREEGGSISKYQSKYISSSTVGNADRKSDIVQSALRRSIANTSGHELDSKFGRLQDDFDPNNVKVGKLISDLERMQEQERTRAVDAETKFNSLLNDFELEVNLRQELEKKYSQIIDELRRRDHELNDIRVEFNMLINENNALKADLTSLSHENDRLEEFKRVTVVEIEENYKRQLRDYEAQNHSLREKFDHMQRELNIQIVDTRKELESKIRSYEEQVNEFAKLNDELSLELSHQLEYIERLKVENEENVRRAVSRARDEEITKAERIIKGLEDELKQLRSSNDSLSAKNAEMLQDLQAYERQIRDQHIQFANELARLGAETDRLRAELSQANGIIQKQNSELAARDSVIASLEAEVERYKAEIHRITESFNIQIENIKREFETERRRFDESQRQLVLNIEELERRLGESQSETIKISREYDRLVEIMQGNVSRVIQDTFLGVKNSSEIRTIEQKVSTPNRTIIDGSMSKSRIGGGVERRYM